MSNPQIRYNPKEKYIMKTILLQVYFIKYLFLYDSKLERYQQNMWDKGSSIPSRTKWQRKDYQQ